MTLSQSNTIIVAGLGKRDFTGPSSTTQRLKEVLEDKQIPIVHWAPIKSFGRVIVVFETTTDAFNAKLVISANCSDHGWPKLKVFFTQHTPLSTLEENGQSHLKLPDAGRLWLISPPPSPPVGWISREEDAPNTQQTFDPHDLNAALMNSSAKLNRSATAPESMENNNNASTKTPPKSNNNTITRRCTLHEHQPLSVDTTAAPVSPASPSPLSTPTIVLEWDEDDNMTLENDEMKPVRTELPPV